jgi:ribokinase
MGTVVVVGSLNVDLVVGLDRMPNPGETVMGRTLDQHPGGR